MSSGPHLGGGKERGVAVGNEEPDLAAVPCSCVILLASTLLVMGDNIAPVHSETPLVIAIGQLVGDKRI